MKTKRVSPIETSLKIAFLSAGLGNISRGFEIATGTWYQYIKGQSNIEPRLLSGGRYSGAVRLWNCPRNGKIAVILRSLGLIHDGCRLEQLTFSVSVLVHLLTYKPEVIWLQEATLGQMLLRFRRILKLKYKVIFCDGAPVGHTFARQFDYQIFLHQFAMDEALRSGIKAENCAVIPHICTEPTRLFDKATSRHLLDIPVDVFVILCVAAWNRHHKRIDYLLTEVAKTGSKDILLLLCGQSEQETEALKMLAAELTLNVRWHTFTQDALGLAYSSADVFVLPSLNEGLGAVLIEAGLYGVPIICHPHHGARFILGDRYQGLTDLSISGNLSKKILAYKQKPRLELEGLTTKAIVNKNFSSRKLLDDFLNFINQTRFENTGCSTK